MKDYKKIEELKQNYMNIEISNELDDVVNDAFNTYEKNNKRKNIYRGFALTACLTLIVGVVNLSPAIAETLDDIPIIGSIIRVINFKNYQMKQKGYIVSIDVPKIEGLSDKDLENEINKSLEKEGKDLYNEYLNEVKLLEDKSGEGRALFQSWYETLTDNENILSVVIYKHYAQGSSSTTRKIYNIDKKKQTVVTLNRMFAGSDYVTEISKNIKSQMKSIMAQDPNRVFWDDFEKINEDHTFYINDNNEIVICFDEYEVAPGSEGLVEFIIPKEVTNNLLAK